MRARGRRWWSFFLAGALTSTSLAIVFGMIIEKLYSRSPVSRGRTMPQGTPNPVVSPPGSDEFYAEYRTSSGPMGAYFVSIRVGTGQITTIETLLDTGSADTWFDQARGLSASSSFKENPSESYSIAYMGGQVTGNIGSDTMSLGNYTWSQSFVVVQANNIGLSGILGLAPGCGSKYGICALANWNMKSSVISFYYDRLSWKGRVTFGYMDEAMYCASGSRLTYVEQMGNFFWTSKVDLAFGSNNSLGTGLTAVFDTGTTYFMLSQPLYQRMMQLANASGGCSAPTISVTISGVKFTIPTAILLISNANGCSLRLDRFDEAVFPFDLIIGATFLVNFYTVMDLANNRIGVCPSRPGLGGGRRLAGSASADAISLLLDAPERRGRWRGN